MPGSYERPYSVCNASSNDHSLRNQLFVGQGDPHHGHCVRMVQLREGATSRTCPGVYLVGTDPAIAPYSLAVSGFLRRTAQLNLQDNVEIEIVNDLKPADLIVFKVTRIKPIGNGEAHLDSEEQLMPLALGLKDYPVALDVQFVRSLYDMYLTFTVSAITVGNSTTTKEAMITRNTQFSFESAQSFLHISGQTVMRNLFKHDALDITKLGIGGLDAQFAEIFRGAFASRAAPVEVMRKMNFQHTKGILLYGPPGTGKTLVARQIGKLLNSVEPKVVNGPEILDKFVGESEKKVRELFAEAEADERSKGDASPLHVIIFDEIDAICKQRGTVGGGTGVHDSIVNTLLTKIDGVESLNNVLLIGMTNRPDMLDDALVRPGRLELKIEIGLPDEKGRLQILNIHTAKMKEHKFLGGDVNLDQIAEDTKNFTGAELAAVVRRATAWALDEMLNKKDLSNQAKDFHPVVEMRHFRNVIDSEIKPAYGAATEAISSLFSEGIWPYGPRFERLVQIVNDACNVSDDVPKMTILLEGEPGTGKTALAAYIAKEMNFPFVKVVDFDQVMGKSEGAIVDLIKKAFDDALKSPLSMLILDDLAKLMSFAVHGPRYSLPLVQTIVHLLNKRPPPGKQMVVLATADLDVSRVLQLHHSFKVVQRMSPLVKDEVIEAIRQSGMCSQPGTLEMAVSLLPDLVHVSIKQLTMCILASSPAKIMDIEQWKSWVDVLRPSAEPEFDEL